MDQLVGLLDVQLRNLTPGGKDSAARSLNKVRHSTFEVAEGDPFQGLCVGMRLAVWRGVTQDASLGASALTKEICARVGGERRGEGKQREP